MGIQLSDLVENTVGKEEIARYEQSLPFPHCFQNEYLWSIGLNLQRKNRIQTTRIYKNC